MDRRNQRGVEMKLWTVLCWSNCMDETTVLLYHNEQEARKEFYLQRKALLSDLSDEDIQEMYDNGDIDDDRNWVFIRGDVDYGTAIFQSETKDNRQVTNFFEHMVGVK